MFRNVIYNILFFLSLSWLHARPQGHEIEIKINGLSDTTIILGHHFNASMFPDDTIRLNKQGQGVFKGEEKYPGGMYLVFLPTKKYFDFLLDKDQKFYLETDTGSLLESMIIKGSEINSAFLDYQLFMMNKKEKAAELRQKMKNAESGDTKDEYKNHLAALSQEVDEYTKQVIEQNKENFFGTFVKSVQEVKVPDPPKDEQGNIIDSSFQYRYYRSHFFDNFDISDPRLLRTPIYENKVKQYIEKVIPQVPDTIIKEVDMLIESSRNNEELFRYMLVSLFNHYAKSQIMGMDAVYLHIAEKYYIPEATWSSGEFIEDLKERVEKQKPLIIGAKAPDIQLVHVPSEHIMEAESDTALKRNVYVGGFFNLHQLRAEFIILYFWEPDCGHCKKAAPKLHSLYTEDLKKYDAKVVAVNMLGGHDGKEKWVDFINKNELYEWINAWNPYSIEYKHKFDLQATNQMYLLDREKNIIAKRISPEQIEKVIQGYKNNE